MVTDKALYARTRRARSRLQDAEGARLRALRAAQGVRKAARIRQLVAEAKSGGCVDCGRKDLPIEVMDLDHVRGERRFALSQAARFGVAVVKEELAKCEARCPTCHALRHYNERTVDHGRYH